MAEFREHGKESWGYTRVKEKGYHCKACGVPVADLETIYAACLSSVGPRYSVLCVPCYEKRQAKKLGDRTDDAAVNRGKPDYEIADIVKASRQLLMKMRVENDPMCKAIDEWDKGDKSTRSLQYPIAVAIRAFPLALSRIAMKEFNGRGRMDPGYYDKHRMELFVKLAIRLRPFLPRITGQMLGRIYESNKAEMAEKARTRGERHAWIAKRDSMPLRLYPITMDSAKFAMWLKRQLPPSASHVCKEFGYWDDKERERELGVLKVAEGNWKVRATVTVYNTPKGPRFLVTYTE